MLYDSQPTIAVSIAKNEVTVNATKKTKIYVITDQGFSGIIENVLFASDIPDNLLSVRKMQTASSDVIFGKDGGAQVIKDGKIIMLCKPGNNLN